MIDLDTIVSLCKRRGFIFQSSEIYGGLGSAWDYGPLGVELKRNIKNLWWRDNVHLRDDMVGLDAAITMHPKVWEASGHVGHFADPFTGCGDCGRYYRADHTASAVVESKWYQAVKKALAGPSGQKDPEKAVCNWAQSDGKKLAPNLPWVKNPNEPAGPLLDLLAKSAPLHACPSCGGRLSDPRPANLMLHTLLGPVEQTALKVYLRPETAQGIFVNFVNVAQSTRKKLPFGIAQVGKAFRNEITPGNFTFRTREFEQMEIEYFCMPGTDEEWHQRWIDERFAWYPKYGIRKENLRQREHAKDELAHYAKRTVDIEYLFPMGWSELEGIANRTDYDLKQHAQFSGQRLTYFDEEKKVHIVPYVIEPSGGADRATLAFLVDAYTEEQVRGEKRVSLRFHPEIAPIKIAVLPLLRNRPDVVETAHRVCDDLRRTWMSVYDDTAAIGRLYRRQDEVGTPFCVTVDVQTVGDKEKGETDDQKVTVRERDSMEQIRVPIADLPSCMRECMDGRWAEAKRRHPAQPVKE
ncbi:MAG: glycine--tRNA ligase [Planctomycetes bacterium]|nr:glycine--tRNA ligase [Planctomycetota bacterium]